MERTAHGARLFPSRAGEEKEAGTHDAVSFYFFVIFCMTSSFDSFFVQKNQS